MEGNAGRELGPAESEVDGCHRMTEGMDFDICTDWGLGAVQWMSWPLACVYLTNDGP